MSETNMPSVPTIEAAVKAGLAIRTRKYAWGEVTIKAMRKCHVKETGLNYTSGDIMAVEPVK